MIHLLCTYLSHVSIRPFFVAKLCSHHCCFFSAKIGMNSFICPFCVNERKFVTFVKFFRHITVFHQNESRFKIVCDLKQTCGALYRTFSAYKSHIYRCHQDELNSIGQPAPMINLPIDDEQYQQITENNDSNSLQFGCDEEVSRSDDECAGLDEDLDENWYELQEILKRGDEEGDSEVPIDSIIKSYVLFILQLREECFLPKSTMNTITNYIITLIERFQILVRKNAQISSSSSYSLNSTSTESIGQTISVGLIEEQFRDVCQRIQAITKNEYRFANFVEICLAMRHRLK